jgi:hypothetical protein
MTTGHIAFDVILLLTIAFGLATLAGWAFYDPNDRGPA